MKSQFALKHCMVTTISTIINQLPGFYCLFLLFQHKKWEGDGMYSIININYFVKHYATT